MVILFNRLLGCSGLALLGLLAVSGSGNLRAEDPVRIIAHRGGVVDARHPENSAGALEEAIRRHYWMVEMDISESKDGHLVVHHDDFLKSFGDKRWPQQMTWEEISKLRAKEDNSRPLEFHEYAPLCRNRMRLMVDCKGTGHPQSFYAAVERLLRENGLMEGAYFLGTAEAHSYFKGKAPIEADRALIEQAMRSGENIPKLYFLFEHGHDLDEKSIAVAKRAGVPAIVSINIDHYKGMDHMKMAHADLLRVRGIGVTYFQIDSVYDVWLQ